MTQSYTNSNPKFKRRLANLFRSIYQKLRDKSTMIKSQPAQSGNLEHGAAAGTKMNAQEDLAFPIRKSKGVSVYSYISASGYSVQFSVPGSGGIITNTAIDNFAVKDLEVDTKNTGLGVVGRFQWRVLKDGVEKATAYNEINALTGNLEGGTMRSMQDCIPIVTPEVIITYLFYDAGNGEAGLTTRDQCLVTVTPTTNKSWMDSLAPPGSKEAQKPFSSFVLAAPHDPGMNSMKNCDAALNSIQTEHLSTLFKGLPNLTFFKDAAPTDLINMIPNIVYALAFTETAPVLTMLGMGARYFEFRPAKLHPIFKATSSLPDTYYFTHALLPGISFAAFLADIVTFLDANRSEIVVVHIRWDGIVNDCPRPTSTEITQFLTTACSHASGLLRFTQSPASLSKPIDTLRTTSTRLIAVTEIPQYSSYSDAAYATLTAAPIIAQFAAMSPQGQGGTDLRIMQCQATATNIKDVVVYSVLSSDASNSPLSETKAMLDRATLPWLKSHLVGNVGMAKTVVIMNDFIDGGTIDVAIEASRLRLAMT